MGNKGKAGAVPGHGPGADNVAQEKQTGLRLLVPVFAAASARKPKSLARNNKT
jgi:hypothetical protein